MILSMPAVVVAPAAVSVTTVPAVAEYAWVGVGTVVSVPLVMTGVLLGERVGEGIDCRVCFDNTCAVPFRSASERGAGLEGEVDPKNAGRHALKRNPEMTPRNTIFFIGLSLCPQD